MFRKIYNRITFNKSQNLLRNTFRWKLRLKKKQALTEIDWLVALRTVGHDGTVWFLLEQLRKRRTGSTQQRGQARTGPARSAR